MALRVLTLPSTVRPAGSRLLRLALLSVGGVVVVAAAFFLKDGVAFSRPSTRHLAAPTASGSATVKAKTTANSGKNAGKGMLARTKRGSGATPVLAEPTMRPDNRYGVYLTPTSVKRADFLKQTMDSIVAAGGNAFVMDVKGSFVYFQSDAPMAVKLDQIRPAYDIKAVVDQAHERDLYVIARVIALKDGVFAEKNPQAQVRYPKSGQIMNTTWTDGSHPDTLQYNKEIIEDLVASGVDEVNLDYIRFTTETPDALRGYSGQQKADKIEPFIKMVREVIDRVNPKVQFGISSYAILGWNFPINLEALGQDVVRFAPYLDIISPMAYPATFTSPEYYNPAKHPRSRNYWLVYRTMTGYRDLLGPEHAKKLRPWIQGYYVGAKDVKDQIEAVYDAGFCGFTMWNANNNYEQSYLGMKQALPNRPERCK